MSTIVSTQTFTDTNNAQIDAFTLTPSTPTPTQIYQITVLGDIGRVAIPADDQSPA